MSDENIGKKVQDAEQIGTEKVGNTGGTAPSLAVGTV